MTPAQQPIMAQWNAQLQQTSAQLQQLLQQAGAGCQQMIGQNPTDATPLSNALGAIDQQVRDMSRRMNDAFSQAYDQLSSAGPGEPGYSQMKRGLRQFERWSEETWHRFDIHWRVEQYRAMWPHVQQALQKPAACTRCGGPLRRTTPHKSETINCPACHTANQVMPETVVAVYYASMPHAFAEQGVMDKQFAHDRAKDEWENYRDAEHAAGRDRPDETIESLKRREAMQRDYWQSYAQAKAQYEGGTPADAQSLVDARMKQYHEDLNRNDVWRVANGMPKMGDVGRVPAHLENVDDFGPLHPNQLEDDFVHDCLLNWVMNDPAQHQQILQQLGYRDATHRAIVHRTFLRRYEQYLSTAEGQGLVSKAAMRAMNERTKLAVAAAGSSGLLDPIEGVSLQVYGTVQAKQPNMQPAAFQQLLAQHQMDQAKWERVQKGWIDKMSKDTTGAIATEYSKAFMNAGQGQFGAAGQAAAGAMGDGGFATQAPAASAEPVSFEKYAEISGAMSAWSKQGKDISAGLDKHFNKMTAQDFSNISMYWSSKMMQDLSSFDRLSKLIAQYEQQYLAMP
jgi:hypothetical protein